MLTLPSNYRTRKANIAGMDFHSELYKPHVVGLNGATKKELQQL